MSSIDLVHWGGRDRIANIEQQLLGAQGALSGVFSVRSYGAAGDGVTNDRVAITNAVNDAVASITASGQGAVVYFPPGVYSISGTSPTQPTNPSTGLPYSVQIGVPLPVNLAAMLVIKGAGRGATTIKLSDNARNVFWINQAADYDTFKNVSFEDLTVDNNSTVGRCHILVGNMPAANTPQRRLNYENINVRRVDILNVGVDSTQATTAKSGFLLLGAHAAALEGTQTHSTDITVEDFRQFGGDNCVAVTSFGAGSLVGGTNHYYNRIYARRCLHQISSPATVTYGQTSFYICGTGFGDYFEITDCESINIADDGIEVGSMQSGLIDGFRCTNPFLVGILFRNTHALQSVNGQKIVVRNSLVQVDSTGGAVSGLQGRPVNWIGDNSQTFGDFHFESFSWSGTGMSFGNHGQAAIAFSLAPAANKISFNKLKVNLSGYTVSTGSGTLDASIISNTATSGVIEFRDLQITASVAASTGAALTYNLHTVLHAGSANRMTVDGYSCDLTGSAWTNSTAGTAFMYQIAKTGGGTIRGRLTGFNPVAPVSIAGVGLRVIGVGNSGNITNYQIANCDLSAISGVTAGRDIEFQSGVNAARVYLRDVNGLGSIRLGPGGRRSTAADYTMLPYDTTLGVTDTSVARTITLPAANAVPVGQILEVVDESNGAATHNITVQRAGADTFTDAATSKTISTNGGNVKVYTNGTNWVVA